MQKDLPAWLLPSSEFKYILRSLGNLLLVLLYSSGPPDYITLLVNPLCRLHTGVADDKLVPALQTYVFLKLSCCFPHSALTLFMGFKCGMAVLGV